MSRMNDNVQLPVAGMRKRRMMLMFPVLIIPFLTLGFWALGGGKGNPGMSGNGGAGLNLRLPDGEMKNETLDKLGFYDKADKDSLRRVEEMRSDPFYSDHASIEKANEMENVLQRSSANYHPSLPLIEKSTNNPQGAEEKLVQKLNELNSLVNQQGKERYEPAEKLSGIDAGGLQPMVQGTHPQREQDPELEQLNSMMDKIIKIQHPGESKDKAEIKNDLTWKVSPDSPGDTMSLGFYSAGKEDEPTGSSNAMRAVVEESQTLVNGSIIKLRLSDDIFIRGEKIGAGTSISGTVTLNGERMNITVNSIRYNSSVYEVKLQIFDLDGLPGIYIPGAATREVGRQSVDNNLQHMDFATLDPSLAAQVTTAGINTAKNLLGKKLKLTKVFVKAGYLVLVKNQNL